jgi:hypothetical protein
VQPQFKEQRHHTTRRKESNFFSANLIQLLQTVYRHPSASGLRRQQNPGDNKNDGNGGNQSRVVFHDVSLRAKASAESGRAAGMLGEQLGRVGLHASKHRCVT